MPQLLECDHLPDDLLTLAPREIRRVFPEPSLVTPPCGPLAQGKAPLFVSVMLHGNEITGFLVLQRLKRWLDTHQSPRPLMIFIGNVHAAEAGLRHLDGQPDYNRIWAGGDLPEHALADTVKQRAESAGVFASIDIHNNTGTNPHYACINTMEGGHHHLASLFGPTVVFYDNPPTTQSMAFNKFCPSVTVEAGKPGEPSGVERAFDLVLDALHIRRFKPVGADRPTRIYRTVGRMEIAPEARFSFSQTADCDLVFPENLDHWNFVDQESGAKLARLNSPSRPICVYDEARRDITDRFLSFSGDFVELIRPATPSMLTLDPDIIRSDCLGYLMEAVDE